MNTFKLLLITFLTALSLNIAAQEVEQTKYEKAVDYVIYQITQVSLEDNGVEHLKDFKSLDPNRNYNFERLVEFLKTRESGVLTQNLELVYNINTYKEKYSETLAASEYYTLLTGNLIQESYIQNFKLKHQTSFPKFEKNIDEYLTYLFELNPTTTEVIDNGMGDVVMGETESSNVDNIDATVTLPPNEKPKEILPSPPTYVEEKPSIKQPQKPIFDNYSPFTTEDGEPVINLSSWIFRISLLCAALALLLYVLLPYYEKREKSKVKKPGGEIHPTVLALEAELNMVRNNNRIMREKLRTLHLDLDDYEDTFKTY